MPKIKHPKFEGFKREVEHAEEWLAAGWLVDDGPGEPSGVVEPTVTPDAPSTGTVTPDA